MDVGRTDGLKRSRENVVTDAPHDDDSHLSVRVQVQVQPRRRSLARRGGQGQRAGRAGGPAEGGPTVNRGWRLYDHPQKVVLKRWVAIGGRRHSLPPVTARLERLPRV